MPSTQDGKQITSVNSIKSASSNFYAENFTSTAYLDDSATTTYRWGMGDISLQKKNVTVSRTGAWGRLFIVGDLAYKGSGELSIYNISDPSSPVQVGYYDWAIYCYDLYVDNGFVFVAAGALGLHVFNVTDPTAISYLTSIDDYYVDNLPLLQDYQDARDVWVIGGTTTYVYILDDFHGFVSFIFTAPNTIVQTGGYDPYPDGQVFYPLYGDLFIEGDIAFCTYGTLLMVDISVRDNPTYLNTYTNGQLWTMFVSGDIIYVEARDAALLSLKILNVSNPLSPVLISSTPIGYSSYTIGSISASNNHACIGYSIEIATDTFEGHFDSYNVTDLSNPSLEHSYISPTIVHAALWTGVNQIVLSNNYGYMADTKFFIIELNLLGQYESPATAQSTAIYTGTGKILYKATLSTNSSIPPSSGISYYLTPDNGSHWERIYPDNPHTFSNMGSTLKWRATISTNNSYSSPVIYSINISYITVLNAVNLTTPTDAYILSDTTPYFEWTTISGAISYLFQLDTSSSFSSPDFQNITVTGFNYYTPQTALKDAVWYWRIAPIDGEGDIGIFSTTFTFTIDFYPSIKINSPSHLELCGNAPFEFNVEIQDSTLDKMWYNIQGSPTNIIFTSNGTIEHTLWQTFGSGILNIIFYANDSFGQTSSDSVTIVKDVDVPIISIIEPHSGQTYYSDPPNYEITVIEPNIESMWYTFGNDTIITNFYSVTGSIDQAIWDIIPPGDVTFKFYVQDEVGNTNYEEITITKKSGSPPSDDPFVPGYDHFIVMSVIIIMSVILVFKQKKKK